MVQLRKEVADLKAALAVESVADVTQDPSYDRPPDYSKLQLTASVPTTLEDFKGAIDEWLLPDFSKGSWQVLASQREKIRRVTVHFPGVGGAKKAEKARQTRHMDGKWHPLVSQKDVEISVNQDESPKTSKTKWALRALKRVLERMYPKTAF
eukprot:6032217-Karenia_brevis.AAC.1